MEKYILNIILYYLSRYYIDPLEYIDWKYDFFHK